MTPLLIPKSQRRNGALQQALAQLSVQFQIREIGDSPSMPGDFVLPSLGIACVLAREIDEIVRLAADILQRRRCVILVPSEDVCHVQLR
jgi:hypothetical protein